MHSCGIVQMNTSAKNCATSDCPDSSFCCAVCGGELKVTADDLFDTRFGIPQSFSSAECLSCSLEQITPRPEQGQLKHLYEQFYNFGGGHDSLYSAIRRRFLLSAGA